MSYEKKNRIIKVGCCIAAALCVGGGVLAVTQLSFSYDDVTGPAHWEALGFCPTGAQSQSPINVVTDDVVCVDAEDLPELVFEYEELTDLEVFNNGRTVEAEVHHGSELLIDGKRFELLQFHFHTLSEHLIDGEAFPLEMHFVHAADDGELAVVGVMIEADDDVNGELARVFDVAPGVDGQGVFEEVHDFVLEELLPQDRTTYRYSGSLTTPPCTEGVLWHLMTEPISTTDEQIAIIQEIFGDPIDFPNGNRRPTQPLN